MLPNVTKEHLSSIRNSHNEFLSIIQDLTKNEKVQEMRKFNQHADISCYKHCMQVAYLTYLVCKKLNFDYVSATRGAMLHDMFLYDWHTTKMESKKFTDMHAFSHPKTALKNALETFELNDIEKDVIVNHMWPVTIKPPRYKETIVVTFADKFSATRETFSHIFDILHTKKLYKYAYVFLSLIIFRIV